MFCFLKELRQLILRQVCVDCSHFRCGEESGLAGVQKQNDPTARRRPELLEEPLNGNAGSGEIIDQRVMAGDEVAAVEGEPVAGVIDVEKVVSVEAQNQLAKLGLKRRLGCGAVDQDHLIGGSE